MENEAMKTVTILLTKYSDLVGRFICRISKNRYSHASISIDEAEEIFYSFNTKGFVIEKPKKRMPKKRIPGSVCIRMQVPAETYELIKKEIDHFIEKKNSMHTLIWEWCFVCCIFHINLKIAIFVRSLLRKSYQGQVQ